MMTRCGVAFLVVGALALPAAPANADPGEPDQPAAAAGVYSSGGPGEVLGETPAGNSGDGGPGVLGDPPGSNPVTPVSDESSPSAGVAGAGDEGVRSLPFTGYAALLVMGLAVALLTVGGAVRIAARHPNAAA
jgi:hypothetical protein